MQTVLEQQNNIYAEGACVGQDKDYLFFSDRPDELAQAQAICDTCPVKIQCLLRPWIAKRTGACGVVSSSGMASRSTASGAAVVPARPTPALCSRRTVRTCGNW